MSAFLVLISHMNDAVTAKTVDAETWDQALELARPIAQGVRGIRSIKVEVKSGLFKAVTVPTIPADK